MGTLPFNKVCEIEDFGDPSLRSYIREAMRHKVEQFGSDYPLGFENRKDWEIGMAVRALDELGVVKSDALILGVGAGKEAALFSLTRQVGRVFATDLYYEPGDWKDYAPSVMLVEPAAVTSVDFDEKRLVVQHMDGRCLRYPDNSFDGIFSSGSVEHFGKLDEIAAAMYEMGRVLKPGGIVTLSTEFLLRGSDGATAIPGTVLFDEEALRRYIIEASGLQPVDDLVTQVSERTISEPVDLVELLEARRRSPILERDEGAHRYPALVMSHEGRLFGSVHLALRKSEDYPKPNNRWAEPKASLIASIRARNIAAAGHVVPALKDGVDDEDLHESAGVETARFRRQLQLFQEALERESDAIEEHRIANVEESTEVVVGLEHLDRARFSRRVDVRQELDVLQTQYQGLERRVLGSREKINHLNTRLTDLLSHAEAILERLNSQDQLIERLNSQNQLIEQLRSANQTLHRTLQEIGPSSLGLARRLTVLARRYPRAAAAGKTLLWSLLRLSRRVANAKGGRRS